VHYPELLGVDGVAGAWRYATTDRWTLLPSCHGDPQYTTVVYLDGDPATTADAIAPILERRWDSGQVRPVFAGPLRTMMQWDAWR
jgi:hypothetical protein